MKIASIISCLIGLFFLFIPYGYQMIGLGFLFLSLLLLLVRKHPKIVISLLAVICPIILLMEIPIIHSAHTTAPDDVDYLIVLGAGVNGTTPSLSLLDRLEATADFMLAHPDCKAVVSGGQGAGEDITEAQAMTTYLLNQGIAADRILPEDKATNTIENIRFSYAIIEQESSNATVAIVSSEYHLYRAKLIANHLGYDVYTVAAPTSKWLLKINYFLREAPAVIKTRLTLS